MRDRHFGALLLTVLILIAAACSRERQGAAGSTVTPEESPAATQKLDACKLVSKAEVEQTIGHDVADPQPNPNNPAVCEFSFAGHGAVGFLVQRRDPRATADTMIEELRKRKIPVSEVGGVGDRAFFASHGYGMTQLNAFKGQQYVILTMLIPGAGEAKQQAASEELMRKALSSF